MTRPLHNQVIIVIQDIMILLWSWIREPYKLSSMIRIPVYSSYLSSVGYDTSKSVLEVEFHSGGVFQFQEVPYYEYLRLMRAGSHGQYFHYYIRNRYQYREVEPEKLY